MKNWRFAILTLLCLGLQFTLPQLWPPLRYVDFFLVLVYQASLGTSCLNAVGRGWIAGLCQDLVLTTYYPLGVQATAKMSVGLAASVTGRLINLEHPGIQTAFVLLFGCLNNGLVLLLFVIFGQPPPVGNLLPLLLGVIATAILNLCIWLVASWFRPHRLD